MCIHRIPLQSARVSLVLPLPHPLLLTLYTHLTLQLTMHSIISKVYWRTRVLCIPGIRGNAVYDGSFDVLCVYAMWFVYIFFLLVHFLCWLSPLGWSNSGYPTCEREKIVHVSAVLMSNRIAVAVIVTSTPLTVGERSSMGGGIRLYGFSFSLSPVVPRSV